MKITIPSQLNSLILNKILRIRYENSAIRGWESIVCTDVRLVGEDKFVIVSATDGNFFISDCEFDGDCAIICKDYHGRPMTVEVVNNIL